MCIRDRSGTKLTAQILVLGQGQEAGHRLDGIVTDHDSTVMQRCVWYKNVYKKLPDHKSFQLNAGADYITYFGLALQNDQSDGSGR